MSSKAMTNFYNKSLSTSLIMCWITLGAEVSPYGITLCLEVVLKAVFHSSPSRILTRLYALCKSSFVIYLSLL